MTKEELLRELSRERFGEPIRGPNSIGERIDSEREVMEANRRALLANVDEAARDLPGRGAKYRRDVTGDVVQGRRHVPLQPQGDVTDG